MYDDVDRRETKLPERDFTEAGKVASGAIVVE
jgi:hypothetical protein